MFHCCRIWVLYVLECCWVGCVLFGTFVIGEVWRCGWWYNPLLVVPICLYILRCYYCFVGCKHGKSESETPIDWLVWMVVWSGEGRNCLWLLVVVPLTVHISLRINDDEYCVVVWFAFMVIFGFHHLLHGYSMCFIYFLLFHTLFFSFSRVCFNLNPPPPLFPWSCLLTSWQKMDMQGYKFG